MHWTVSHQRHSCRPRSTVCLPSDITFHLCLNNRTQLLHRADTKVVAWLIQDGIGVVAGPAACASISRVLRQQAASVPARARYHQRGTSAGAQWFCKVRPLTFRLACDGRWDCTDQPCTSVCTYVAVGLVSSEMRVFFSCMPSPYTSCCLHRSHGPQSVKPTESVRPVSTDATASYGQGITLSREIGYKPQEQSSIERYSHPAEYATSSYTTHIPLLSPGSAFLLVSLCETAGLNWREHRHHFARPRLFALLAPPHAAARTCSD